MSRRLAFIVIVIAAGLAGCTDSPTATEPPELQAAEVASGLSAPVQLAAPRGDPRLFVVEQAGRIRVVEDGQLLEEPFLDITDRVVSGGERGLLGLAFHPDYASNGYFFVNYTGTDDSTRVERYRVSADPNRADPTSALPILAVEQPLPNHNGGLVKFGPDGMLYIGMGDGGGSGDPLGHGQDRSTLLGALLRIDVDAAEPYAVPADNPFVGEADARPEIWAIGLRNPWRFSFDLETGLLYIADVGQDRREEINARPASEAGLNYGWNIMEGSLCFDPPTGCDTTGLVPPVLEYATRTDGCSVTGGYVYRGVEIPELAGHYFYGDYCAGWVRSFRLLANGVLTDERQWALGNLGRITSFGEDAAGELYIVAHEGRVFRLTR